MPRNVEIKARIDGDLNELIERIRPFADGPPRQLIQCDTFFHCPSGGRLKLRVEQDSPSMLIYYERNDTSSLSTPKLSNYFIAPTSHPNELKMSGSIDGRDLFPHDRAILRAYRSSYRPRNVSSSYFIGHIPPSCTEEDLKEIFSKATEIDLIRDIVTRESKGYAFANGFIDRKKEYRWRGHLFFIEDVASRKLFGWKPRRCGGGLGGNKQSGQLRFGGSERPFKRPFQNQINEQIEQRWKFLQEKSDEYRKNLFSKTNK